MKIQPLNYRYPTNLLVPTNFNPADLRVVQDNAKAIAYFKAQYGVFPTLGPQEIMTDAEKRPIAFRSDPEMLYLSIYFERQILQYELNSQTPSQSHLYLLHLEEIGLQVATGNLGSLARASLMRHDPAEGYSVFEISHPKHPSVFLVKHREYFGVKAYGANEIDRDRIQFDF